MLLDLYPYLMAGVFYSNVERFLRPKTDVRFVIANNSFWFSSVCFALFHLDTVAAIFPRYVLLRTLRFRWNIYRPIMLLMRMNPFRNSIDFISCLHCQRDFSRWYSFRSSLHCAQINTYIQKWNNKCNPFFQTTKL